MVAWNIVSKIPMATNKSTPNSKSSPKTVFRVIALHDLAHNDRTKQISTIHRSVYAHNDRFVIK